MGLNASVLTTLPPTWALKQRQPESCSGSGPSRRSPRFAGTSKRHEWTHQDSVQCTGFRVIVVMKGSPVRVRASALGKEPANALFVYVGDRHRRVSSR